MESVKVAEKLYRKVRRKIPSVAGYILTNAHRRRVLLTLNMREMYHFSRLRSDSHAQWEIREISNEMCRIAQKVMPVSAALLSGKDGFDEAFNKLNKILDKHDITY